MGTGVSQSCSHAPGKLFMNRVEKMKHIAIIVLCGKYIFFAHTNAFRYLDRSKVIRFYD